MIHDQRVHPLNDHQLTPGEYVLYWMQAAVRTRFNHALEYAIDRANELNLPLLVCFGLMDGYPEANLRHYTFLVQGLADVHGRLKSRHIKFVVRHGSPDDVALHYARSAALVVIDQGYMRIQKRWYEHLADAATCPVAQVETDVVVPVDTVSNKHEYAARTIRPKIHKLWEKFLQPLRPRKLKHSSLRLHVDGNLDPTDVTACLKKLKLDTTVGPVDRFTGGETEAQRRFKNLALREIR